MGWRAEKIKAKRAAGLCIKLNPDCGSKAVPGYDECKKHMPPGQWFGRLAADLPRTPKPN